MVEDNPIGVEAALLANMTAVFYNPSGFDVPDGAITIKKMQELVTKVGF